MTVIKLILVLALLAALPIGLVAACGRSFLYYPTRLGDAELRILSSQPGWRLEQLSVTPGVTLNGLVRPPSEPTRPWLIFHGGNAMGLAAGQALLALLAGEADWGLAVWAYRGYDGSGGRPTEEGLNGDAELQVVHLEEAYGVAPERLVIMGQSLGSGIAAHATAWLKRRGTPTAGLVLLSPYTSISRVADDSVPLLPVGWAMADSYRTDRLLDDIPGPVLIVHGTKDTLIGLKHGEELAKGLGGRAELLRVGGAGHNDLWDDGATVMRMRAFVANCAPAPLAPTADPTE